jgi:hypothetical protein
MDRLVLEPGVGDDQIVAGAEVQEALPILVTLAGSVRAKD